MREQAQLEFDQKKEAEAVYTIKHFDNIQIVRNCAITKMQKKIGQFHLKIE